MKFNGKLSKNDADEYQLTLPNGETHRVIGQAQAGVKPGDIVVIDGDPLPTRGSKNPAIHARSINRL